jgi:hypothetical protein
MHIAALERQPFHQTAHPIILLRLTRQIMNRGHDPLESRQSGRNRLNLAPHPIDMDQIDLISIRTQKTGKTAGIATIA